jgi:hypothetical protein
MGEDPTHLVVPEGQLIQHWYESSACVSSVDDGWYPDPPAAVAEAVAQHEEEGELDEDLAPAV